MKKNKVLTFIEERKLKPNFQTQHDNAHFRIIPGL